MTTDRFSQYTRAESGDSRCLEPRRRMTSSARSRSSTPGTRSRRTRSRSTGRRSSAASCAGPVIPSSRTDLTGRDVEGFRALRGRLRAAFEADSEADAVAALNRILAQHPTVSELAQVEGGWRFQHRASHPKDVAAALAPECSIALLAAIRDRGWSRLGICSAAPCTCVYVDQSRNRSRRYCSDLCNDRMSQAAHRRRRR